MTYATGLDIFLMNFTASVGTDTTPLQQLSSICHRAEHG